MNYKDVRIGNLVKYRGKIYRMAGISDTYPFLDTIEFGAGGIDWNELEGVELTFDVVKGFGFSIVPQGYAFLNLGSYYSAFGDIEGEFAVFVESECIVTGLNYAHQIQNVVHSLLGIELEYNPTPE
jgi:hypothetical protein